MSSASPGLVASVPIGERVGFQGFEQVPRKLSLLQRAPSKLVPSKGKGKEFQFNCQGLQKSEGRSRFLSRS